MKTTPATTMALKQPGRILRTSLGLALALTLGRRNRALQSAALLLLTGAGALSAATTVTDFNFDSLTLGQPLPTTTPGVDPFPQGTVYSVDGFPDVGPLTGTVTVQNVGGLNKAALMTTTQGGTGSLFVDTQFLTGTVSTMNFSFDIHVVDVPTSGLPQAGVGALDGQAFTINAFGMDSQRLFRFAVAPTSATGGNFAYRLPGLSGDLQSFGSYLEGGTHHVEFQVDFDTDTMDILLDSIQVVTDAALLNPGTGASEFFLFQNGVEGVTNSVAVDNIVTTTTAVPEPSTWASLAFGVAGLLAFRRRSAPVT